MAPNEDHLIGAQLKGFPLHIHTNVRLKVPTLIQSAFKYPNLISGGNDSAFPSNFFNSNVLNLIELFVYLSTEQF